jgi:diguanylate cyclase (GGDEF)-like protein
LPRDGVQGAGATLTSLDVALHGPGLAGGELARSERYGRPLSLVLLDIDDFKAVNDRWGHVAGDNTLRELAACVRTAVRKEELFARYGGEEFAVVLPETTCEAAAAFAERARAEVAAHEFRCDGDRYPLTISLGVAGTLGEPQTSQELIRRADQALYQAKSAGKNCARVWSADLAFAIGAASGG